MEADGGEERRGVADVGEGGAELVAVLAAGVCDGCWWWNLMLVVRSAAATPPAAPAVLEPLPLRLPPANIPTHVEPTPQPPPTHVKKISWRPRWTAAPIVSPAPKRGPYSSPLPLAA